MLLGHFQNIAPFGWQDENLTEIKLPASMIPVALGLHAHSERIGVVDGDVSHGIACRLRQSKSGYDEQHYEDPRTQ